MSVKKNPLLILHGALGAASQFESWKKEFSERYECYTFDFQGHGLKSGDGEAFSIELFSENLRNYIAKHDLQRPHILGYSMGGYVALYMASKYAGILGNILTLATKFDWNPQSAKKEAGYLDPQIMLQKVPGLAAQLKERHGENWEEVVCKTATMMLKLGDSPLVNEETIKAISVPVRYCMGDREKMVSVQETFSMYKATPGATFSVLPSTPHLPELMPFERIVFEVNDFLLPKAPPAN